MVCTGFCHQLRRICVCGRHWKGGQEQVALPPSSAHLQHPSIWQGQGGSAVSMVSEMVLKKLQTCALPSLSALCVLAPDWEAPHFSAAYFIQYWDKSKKLAELGFRTSPHLSFVPLLQAAALLVYCLQPLSWHSWAPTSRQFSFA